MSTWQDRCRAKGPGHTPTVFPDGPHRGEPACRYIDAQGTPRYALADLSITEQLHQFVTNVGEKISALEGKAAGAAQSALEELRPTNLIGSVLGVPRWVVLLAIGVVGYQFLRSELDLPPLVGKR